MRRHVPRPFDAKRLRKDGSGKQRGTAVRVLSTKFAFEFFLRNLKKVLKAVLKNAPSSFPSNDEARDKRASVTKEAQNALFFLRLV